MKIYLHLQTKQLASAVGRSVLERSTQEDITRQELVAVAIKVPSKQTSLQDLLPLLAQKLLRKYAFPKDFSLFQAADVIFNTPQGEAIDAAKKVTDVAVDKGGKSLWSKFLLVFFSPGPYLVL